MDNPYYISFYTVSKEWADDPKVYLKTNSAYGGWFMLNFYERVNFYEL